ncbi:integrin hypothetical protein [Limosa lapponica baueri]|uniref:VWFA domain-containing protein n=1 Tax=Limosa lapponica baueri TaxID=1758121 RepID=A0A2I0T8Q6_LIMLA|nr:integrin hypothetical protein [Limosa lapponica baueri]
MRYVVGVVQYGEDVVHEFHLNDYSSEAFQKGGRKGAKRVMIVITDGESHDSPDLEKVIEDSEKDNVTRYAVAVLGYYNRRGINPEAFLNEIKFIASDPDDKHFFNVTDEAALKDIVDALGERIFSLEGYTVSSVISTEHERIYVAGAPRFNHTGKVIIFSMHNNRNLTIHQALKGEQIGSYYGSEINSLDVNGDGITDVLLVGAPMYFSEGRERGKVYVYTLRENRFVSSGALVDLQSYQNSRFGSCIAAVPDLNQDSYNDLVVGAPLEDEHQGAIYIFLGFKETILKKYKQRIAAADLAPGLMYFGCSIHGQLDLNEDGLVDLAVGSLGNAVLLCSSFDLESGRFAPRKYLLETGNNNWLRYNATIDERRYTPRAHLDESGERQTQKGLVLLAGQEHCDRLQFHVLVSAKEDKAGVFSSASPQGRDSRPNRDAPHHVQSNGVPGHGQRNLDGWK